MTETVARLHIALADTDPLIWRRVDVPVDASLKMLHDVIQGAMGWLDYHLWEFEAGDRRYGVPDPDWEDDGLLAAKNAKLKTLLDRDLRQFLYTYDMGDNWEHIVTVEAVRQGEPGIKYPRYVEGERRAPPEDCGGTPGFEAFLEAIANPKHPEHEEVTECTRAATAWPSIPTRSTNAMQNSGSAPSPNAAPPAKHPRPGNQPDKAAFSPRLLGGGARHTA